MPKTLATSPSPWSAVFRAIVKQITANKPILAVVGSADRIKSWTGLATDAAPLAPTQARPMIRLTPAPRSVEWYSPDSQKGWLDVIVEIAVLTYCVDDPIDVWDLFIGAVGPGVLNIKGTPFALDLTEAGAETGEVIFSDPAVDTSIGSLPDGNIMVATGKFTVAVLRATS